ncbi:hypothetical protein ACFQ1S_00535 [Kibdelosporangium lantanae]|uniref:Uncharacterized protein n=1 Tax=Kibdelosporangium lantanae TaxID=1497396 RepID=A0ABW3M2L5_9PSEU
MADSEDGLAALLEESCLDGVLHAQYKVIVDAQPFWGAHENPHIQNVRTALAQLLDWRTRLDEGSQVGAWVTPVEPTLQIAPPIEVQNFDVCGPGELLDRRDIVHFRLANYAPSASVQGQAGSYVDLAFADGFEPTDAEDTFQRRTKNVLDAVLQLMAMFTELVHQVPGSRQLATSSQHTTGWIDANASSWYWSAEQLSGLAASDFGVGVVVGAEHTTLLVRTEQGVFERSIPAVTPLNRFAKRGIAAERAVQDAAATWGLPDFVMAPLVERKGRGVREISDGLLVVGDRGLVVQVKSRDGEPQSLQKETSWITKKIAEAGRQVDGTVRRLSSKTTTMVNGRGRNIDITGTDLAWTGVVIIDHPAVPEDLPAPEMSTRTPTVALVRRDWEFLFHQLRSTRAVIDYLARVVSIEARLGHEPERYYELAAADTQVEPTTVDREIYPRGTVVSLPLLPTAPAGSDDEQAHGMVRIMCEDIANSGLGDADETRRLDALAAIDQLPVAQRTDLGRLLLDGLERARQVGEDHTAWQFRIYQADRPVPQLGFGVCSRLDDVTRAAFRSWVLLRHHERGTHTGYLDTLTSVGVLLTPRHDDYRAWDTTMLGITGDPELTEGELQTSRELWNQSPAADDYPES